MAEQKPASAAPVIVVRRKKGGGHGGHHGGAWKIAYADFVTAMMAFFLLMWLLGSTTQADKAGVADYFNQPLSVALAHGTGTGNASSILQGGGKSITETTPGAVQRGVGARNKTGVAREPAKPSAEQAAQDARRLEAMKSKLQALIDTNPRLKAFKNQIRLELTSEGLRIQIIDAQNRPMFESGSAVLESYTKEILNQLAVVLNDVENHVSIAGHTDSLPYSGGEIGYSNWELSAERANAARRQLTLGGMQEKKVLQVRGLGDALPLYRNDPQQAGNRRISIMVLNKRTEDAFYRDGGRVVDIGAAQELPNALGVAGTGGGAPVPAGAATRGMARLAAR